MSGITKTIPQSEGESAVDYLYEEKIGEFDFHMAGKPSKLVEGQFVYTIWKDEIVGRCKIIRIESGHTNPKSGKARSLIFVAIPGEKAKNPFRRKGHRGTRYYDGDDWAG
jgi:hypothetical protein